MDKIQINIATPTLNKIKKLSTYWDKNVSEIIRMAIDRMLNQVTIDLDNLDDKKSFPKLSMGKILTPPDKIRDILSDRN
jgi:hypothetical protein